MIAKLHKTRSGLIVAICDNELLGKKISDENAELDLASDFYNGNVVEDSALVELCRKAYIINAAGNLSVEFLVKNKFVQEKQVIRIKNVPFSQCTIIENEM